MIVVDASALIAHLDADDEQHQRAVERMIELAEQPLGCSSITLAEVFVGPARAGRLEAAERAVRELGVTEIRLGEGAAPRLAGIRAETGLRLPDCCVLLAAQDCDAQAVLTLDDRLDREARRLGF